MPITASIAAPNVIAGSTITGDQPKVTRMEVPGIKGADGDITWQGEWSSATTYTQNEAVQYNGSAYVALQGNSNLIPSSNASSWSVMTSKGDIGATGAAGSAGTVTIGTTTTGSTGGSASVSNMQRLLMLEQIQPQFLTLDFLWVKQGLKEHSDGRVHIIIHMFMVQMM